ncbi:hypothetical protein DL768_004322 [Monosporascus sp. mg162]|nr:hypothetical protein DL768_004322 [Monosporascus sp. mg162]
MQKILRRVATAERVAAKRKKIKETKYFKKEKKEQVTDHRSQVQLAQREFERAKQAVRDHWALGPLAPRQDVGEWAGAHGAIHEARFRSYGRLTLAMRNKRCAWAGGAYNLNLRVNDRVVLLEGPDKGKIGKIASISEETAEVTVAGLNKSNLRVGPEMRLPDDPAAVNIELPLPISAIRLVHPLKDPQTGVTRDVIINQLTHSGMVVDRVTGKREWERVVPGLNVSIPWPPEEPEELKDYVCDTLRIDVEERTFVPTLLRPPMPPTVIDELRNKYSRFRTRHEPEYIARLEAEEREKEERRRQAEQSMRTPLQEFHRQERANKKKKGKPRLTLEMLEKIGEVIARNRERSFNAGGVSEDSSSSSPPSSSSPAASAAEPSAATAESSSSAATAADVPPPPPPQEETSRSPPLQST